MASGHAHEPHSRVNPEAAPRRPGRPTASAPNPRRVTQLSADGILDLQGAVGNRALVSALSGGVVVQRDEPADPAKQRLADLRSAIIDRSLPMGAGNVWPTGLYDWLHKQSMRHGELESAYQKEYNSDANKDMVKYLGIDYGVRASSYFRFGGLRLADKLLFALYGTDFDLETIRRVLAAPAGGSASGNTFAEAEAIFAREFKEHFSDATSIALPNGQTSLIAGILDSKTLQWKRTGYELRALMAFGEFRLVDELAAEIEAPTGMTVAWDKVLTLVDKAPDKNALKASYQTGYHKDLIAEVGLMSPEDPADIGLLDNKHKYLAAMILVKGSVSLNERLRVAVKFKDDLSVVWNYLEIASAAEKKQMREEPLDPSTMSELAAEDKERLNALLAENPTAMQKLTAAGADSGSAVMKVFKNAKGADRELFADALNKGQQSVGDPFVDLVARKTGGDFKNVKTILSGTVADRISFALSGLDDDEDYCYSVLEAASDADKVAILQQAETAGTTRGLMKSHLNDKEYLKATKILLSGAGSMDPLERAKLVRDFGKESLTDPGSVGFTNAYSALADENRELDWAIKATGDNKSPGSAEAADLNAKSGSVLASADSLTKTADSVNDVAAQIAYTAVGLVIAYITAGAGVGLVAGAIETFENVGVRAAVAAVAKGTAKVVINKVAKGASFDATGNDGMAAFLGGAVEGVTDVILPSVAQGLVSVEYKQAMALNAEQAAKAAWTSQPKITQSVTTILTSGTGAALSSFAEATAQDETWKRGLGDDVLILLAKTAQGAATTAAVTAGIEIASPFLAKQAGRISQLIERFQLSNQSVRELSEAEAKWLVLRDQRRAKLGDFDTTGDDWPTISQRLRNRKGGAGADDFALVMDERAALRDLNMLRKKSGLPVGDTFSPPPEPRMIVDKTPSDTPAGSTSGQPADPLSMDIAGQKELSLADKERLAEYTAGVRQMGVSGPLTEANVKEIGAQALSKFAPADMPKPEIVIAEPGQLKPDEIALIYRNGWVIRVNPAELAKPIEDMASALAHEVRHAAQFYLIARYLIAENPGISIDQIAAKMGGTKAGGAYRAMLGKAQEAPVLDLNSPYGAVAHQLYVTEFGPAGSLPKFPFVNPNTMWANDLQKYIGELEKMKARYEPIAKGTSVHAADAQGTVNQLEIMIEEAWEHYNVHRPLEVDAYMVDRLVKLGMNPSSFTKAKPGPVPVPVPPRN
ncbi:hypothetical protein [Mycobacterium sp. 852013-50091_SCH5140682]|uniref:hypothetical protein n=1 Tax=Mycobacterium sp. 852013-50091_SCH5140682 TaxID=1834109 RepID=UPI000AACAAA8|nr:hypothetical protein [Mycobacterium sp. 852013-50091_SCH5140682]